MDLSHGSNATPRVARRIVRSLVAYVLFILASSATAQTWTLAHDAKLVLPSNANDPSKTLTIQAPGITGSSFSWILPDGNAPGVLTNGGTGTLTWNSLLGLSALSSGTSGGVLYFSNTSTLASSGLLASNQVILGGGAGAAPTSLPLGSAYQLVGTNSTASAIANLSLLGTTNQVTVGASGSTITLSTPQDIATTSSPTFAGLTLTSPLAVTSGGTGQSGSLTQGGVVYAASTAAMAVAAAGSAGQVLESNGTGAPSWGCAALAVYGDGADGAITFDGTSTVLGIAPVSNTYTLNRDMFPSSMTVNNGVTIAACGARIYCRGTLTNNGTIENDGKDATGRTTPGAATSSSNYLGVGTAGGSGASNANGPAAPTGPSNSAGGSGGTGGTGGTKTVSSGATATAPTQANGGASTFHSFIAANTGASMTTSIQFTGGAGGSGGGGTGNCGAGGGGGGVLLINAYKIDNTNGTISANGGTGSAAASNNSGGGGGGGGGAVFLIYHTYIGNAATANGGSGGAGFGSGSAGNSGSAGHVVAIQN